MFYGEFAYIYDTLMIDVDYSQWTEAILKLFDFYGVKPVTIADLACGTGNITINLFRNGYEVTGIDISEDMLYVAKEKSRKFGLDIPFIRQDIICFAVHKPMDAITCICDGVNYILSDKDLKTFFMQVYRFLNPNGIFIFDISSYYKLSEILGNNTMFDDSLDVSFIWNNSFNKNNNILTMNLSFFVKEDELYRRIDEEHMQRAYKTEEIIKMLEYCNFKEINCYEAFSLEDPDEESERILFCARK